MLYPTGRHHRKQLSTVAVHTDLPIVRVCFRFFRTWTQRSLISRARLSVHTFLDQAYLPLYNMHRHTSAVAIAQQCTITELIICITNGLYWMHTDLNILQ